MLMKADLKALARSRKETSEYLDRHDCLKQRLLKMYWAFRELGDLIPQTRQKAFSGHFFPYTQAEDELYNCIALAHLGFYHHAIAGLRWVLELGMLSVYWDRSDDAELVIQRWLRAKEKTPFRSRIEKGLMEIPNVARYCERSTFLQDFNKLYEEMSKHVHVRGVGYSSQHLSRGNVIQFNATAFERWAGLAFDVVRLVVAVHLLKYPVGLQETPVEEKFGFSGPMGGFLNPYQVDQLRSIFDADDLATLQAISDADPDARLLAEEFARRPNITRRELERQAAAWEKLLE